MREKRTPKDVCGEASCAWVFEHNKEFILFIKILINLFITMRNLKNSAFDTRCILTNPASDVHERLKTNGTAIKIARETTNNQ